MKNLTFEDFPAQTYDKLRYGDTDRQGHVNNAVFSTFLETGRVEVLYHSSNTISFVDTSFVIASIHLNFRKEVHWPGKIDIGTGILRIGNSSIKFYQMLFQDDACVADAETTIVQVNNTSGKSVLLSKVAKESLLNWKIPI